MKNREKILDKLRLIANKAIVKPSDLTQWKKLLPQFIETLNIIDSELVIRAELHKFIDLVWLIDEKTEESLNEDFSFHFKLREELLNIYDEFIENNAGVISDINKHYLFDKSIFYQIIEREKKNGFKLLHRKIELLENSGIPELKEDFVGRKDKAADIINKLSVNQKISVCISGDIAGDNGGIGKTTLAVQIAHFLSNKSCRPNYGNPLNLSKEFDAKKNFFKDGIIWINVSFATKDVNSVIGSIANQLGYKYLPAIDWSNESGNKIEDKSDKIHELSLNNSKNISGVFFSQKENADSESNNSQIKPTKAPIEEIIEDSREDIVRSLEEIALILNNKKVLIVIDNAEQNREVFEYIFPRLNGFASILVTSRLRMPGIDNILIGNLDKEDSKALFLHGIPGLYHTEFEKSENEKHIEKLCYYVLGGHPMSINLATQCTKLFQIGISQFCLTIEKFLRIIADEQNTTYSKIFSIIFGGELLNDVEEEVLLRGSLNAEHTFTESDILGFCLNENIREGIQSLHEKSILRKDEIDESYIVHQIFRDYSAYKIHDRIKKHSVKFNISYNPTFEEPVERLFNLDLLKLNNISIGERLLISNDIISYLLIFSKDNTHVLEKKCTEYILLLDDYDHNHIDLGLNVSKAFQKISILSGSHNWFKHVEYFAIIDLNLHSKGLVSGTNILRDFCLSSDSWNYTSMNRIISHNYHKINNNLKLDYAISSIVGRIKAKNSEELYLSIDCLSDCLNNLIKTQAFEILLHEDKLLKKDNTLRWRSHGLYFAYLKKANIDKIVDSKSPLKASDLEQTENFISKYNYDSGHIHLEFIHLLGRFYVGDYDFISKTYFSKNLMQNYKNQITALKVLSFYKSGNKEKVIHYLDEEIKHFPNPNLHKIVLFNLLAEYASKSEAAELININDVHGETSNYLTDYLTEMVLIPEGRFFMNTNKKLLLDEDYIIENSNNYFSENYKFDKYKDKDMGTLLYPYLISKSPVSKAEYEKYCKDTNKEFDEEKFSILDAIEYAQYKYKDREMNVATNEEWVKAFTTYNYNLGNTNSEVSTEELDRCKEVSTFQDTTNFDKLMDYLIPKEFLYFLEIENTGEIDKTLSINFSQPIQNLWGVPIELIRLISYSPSINSPKLKHQLVEKTKGNSKKEIERKYLLLLKDLILYLNKSLKLGYGKEKLLLELINQRNQWKVALKFILGLEDYFEGLTFTNHTEMVHSKKHNEDKPIFKIASKGKTNINLQTKQGFTPFRCVKPLPLQFDLLYKTEGYVI